MSYRKVRGMRPSGEGIGDSPAIHPAMLQPCLSCPGISALSLRYGSCLQWGLLGQLL